MCCCWYSNVYVYSPKLFFVPKSRAQRVVEQIDRGSTRFVGAGVLYASRVILFAQSVQGTYYQLLSFPALKMILF